VQKERLAGLSVLVIDDEAWLRRQIAAELGRLGADVTEAGSIEAARARLRDLDFDVALLDVNLPDGKGTELLAHRAFSPGTSVVVMTAEGAVGGAVEAMKLGAADYLVKPLEPLALPLTIERVRRARQNARLEEHRRRDQAGPTHEFHFGPSLASVQAQLAKILAVDRRLETGLPPVLIEGETGTGKTAIARWLHFAGPRSEQPLVEMNCSAVAESLAESELFGHERGAFTDARTTRIGLMEAASGGTLFLDELPSLSAAIQAKLLTAIEDGRIRRVGSNRTIGIDVRIVAATNRDLDDLVRQGLFRQDLYHRLDLCRLRLPALRERGAQEIVALAENLMGRLCRRHGLPPRVLTSAGREHLAQYDWPGNVRELAHELERAIIFEENTRLDFAHLGAGQPPATATDTAPRPPDWFDESYSFPAEGFSIEAALQRLIQHALKQTEGNVSAAARLLGVSRDYLRHRLEGPRS